jgi:GTP-binding protein
VGRIAIGRLYSGAVKPGMDVALMQRDDKVAPARIVTVYVFEDLGRTEVQSAEAGDIVALVGLENIEIGDTVTDRNAPRALPRLVVDEPTLKMTFGVNTSPLAGQEGKYLTSRHLRERLMKELQKNVALRVEPIAGTEQFSVSGRGILHLSVLIETMRREGFELSISKPHVILRDNHGVTEEPFESLVVEVPENQTGPVMEMTGQRRGQLVDMQGHNNYSYMVFSIPSRGLIGLRTRLLNATQGTAVIHHRFECYKPLEGEIETRPTGVLVSLVGGRAVAYALDTLQDRSELHVGHNDVVYEGMIVGENSRSDDMNVNPTKEKKLSNMRAAGHDRNVLLRPARRLSLEEALEFIEDDELVEVTPTQIRLRKILLNEHARRRAARKAAAVGV